MTQEEIKAKHQEIVERRKALNKEMEILKAEWYLLQKQCDHPNKYPTEFMGDRGVRCPDCGYAT